MGLGAFGHCFNPGRSLRRLFHFLFPGVPNPFVPGILLSVKLPKTLGRQLVFGKKDA